MKKLLVTILLALPLCALTAEVSKGLTDKQLDNAEYYSPGFSFDLFGTARTFDLNNARTGAGIGANLFFANNLGVGVEGVIENAAHATVDYAQGNLLWRITSGKAALNLLAGAGWDAERNEIFASVGGGPEYAFTKLFHVFGEGRAQKSIEGGDIHALFRGGIRLSF